MGVSVCPSPCLPELLRPRLSQYPAPHPRPQCPEVAGGYRAADLSRVPESLQIRRPATHAEPVPALDQQVQGVGALGLSRAGPVSSGRPSPRSAPQGLGLPDRARLSQRPERPEGVPGPPRAAGVAVPVLEALPGRPLPAAVSAAARCPPVPCAHSGWASTAPYWADECGKLNGIL